MKNAPDGLYYLDLLIPEETRGSYDNLHGKPYDQALLAGLHVWEGEAGIPPSPAAPGPRFSET